MKIIAVTEKVPYTIKKKTEENSPTPFSKKEKILRTPQTIRSSSIQSIAEREKQINGMQDLEVKHDQVSTLLFRDIKDAIYIGSLEGLERLEETEKKEVLGILQKDFKENGFYPLDTKPFTDFKKRIKNLCFHKNWNDVYNEINDDEVYEEYVLYNKFLAEEILKIYKYGDTIWIPDSQNFILPKFLKEKVSDIKVAVSFLYQFPSSDKFGCFGNPQHFINCLLEASYIDFQSKTDLKNFVNFTKSLLPLNCQKKGKEIFLKGKSETNLGINVFPISKNFPERILKTEKCLKFISDLKKVIGEKKVVVSVTSFETSHTLLNVYKAIEAYLSEFGKDVLFVNLETPEGNFDPQMKAEVGRLEDYLSASGYEDCFLRKCGLPDYKFYGWLSIADCGLFVEDNCAVCLPAADFLAVNENPLLVSKTSRFHEKSGIKTVNPKNAKKFAKKIHDAIFSAENSENKNSGNLVEKERKPFFRNSLSDFLAKIKKGTKKRFKIEKKIPEKETALILEKYKMAKNPIFVFDYDGTLTPIVGTPEKAAPSQKLNSFIKKVQEKNKVILATGRDKKTIEKWFPDKNMEVYAEHGVLHRKDGEWEVLLDLPGWKDSAKEIINYYVERSPGSLLEEKETSLCFHYRGCDTFIQERQAKACKQALLAVFKDYSELEVKEGKCTVEIRPHGRNKGDLIKILLEEEEYDFIFCAGDDFTDEDMFEEGRLKDVFFSVLVGERESGAKFCVGKPDDLISLVEKMIE